MRVIARTAEPSRPPVAERPSAPAEAYGQTLALAARAHRALMAVIAHELARGGHHDVSARQAYLLHALGDREVSAGEIITRGYYIGSNAAYNLKQLVAGGYLTRERSRADLRSVRIRLSPKGQIVRALLDALFARHAAIIAGAGGLDPAELATLTRLMTRLDRFWTHQILFSA